MTKYVLLTGATGLVGQYLVRDLLVSGDRIAVVVRPTKKSSAVDRVESILQMWESELGRRLHRPVVLEGDVSQPRLGVCAEDRKWIHANCDRLIHNAATLQFFGADRSGEPWRTNVEGTRHVLDLCRELEIGDLHYVSTAYVCGQREGTIREDELDCGQKFRNDYEHSKLIAEKMVRDADFLEHTTVYRPAVISGDSVNGYTTSYHGLYVYLKMISVLINNMEPSPDGVYDIPIRLNMTGDEPRNIVPVDWVSQVMCRLMATPEARGKTFHLSPTQPLTPRQVTEFAHRRFNSRGVTFERSEDTDGRLNEIDQLAHDTITTYKDYEASDPHFDTRNLLEFTADIPCPVIDDEMLDCYCRFAEQDKWGKRRQSDPVVPFRVRDYLQQRIPSNNGTNGNGNGRTSVMGLNVLGPGGGQWKLDLHGDAVSALSVGLPLDNAPVLEMTVDQFTRSVEGSQSWREADAGAEFDREPTSASALDALFAE